MKRIICMVLALILCMMLPMTAFAATASVAESGKAPVYTGSDVPKTGDVNRMDIWVPVLVISALALVVLLVIYFKKFRKTN